MGRPDLIGHGDNKLVPAEEKDKQIHRRPQKAKPGQATGASHTSNRPTMEKNAAAEKARRKTSNDAKPASSRINGGPTAPAKRRKTKVKSRQQ
jgi:hypothetical protein